MSSPKEQVDPWTRKLGLSWMALLAIGAPVAHFASAPAGGALVVLGSASMVAMRLLVIRSKTNDDVIRVIDAEAARFAFTSTLALFVAYAILDGPWHLPDIRAYWVIVVLIAMQFIGVLLSRQRYR